jgi:hypothetical protein
MTEKQPYSVVSTDDGFEVRRYLEHMVAQVDVRGDGAGASAAFGPLFQYISGSNAEQQSIAMTAPVVLEPRANGEQTVSFVMPAVMDATTTPQPRDPRVRTTVIGSRLVAAVRFTGTARASRFAEKGRQLLTAVHDAGLQPVGDVYYARFDAPSMPGFLRHNEALVEIAAAPSNDATTPDDGTV